VLAREVGQAGIALGLPLPVEGFEVEGDLPETRFDGNQFQARKTLAESAQKETSQHITLSHDQVARVPNGSQPGLLGELVAADQGSLGHLLPSLARGEADMEVDR